jgi:hypothetical protein
MLFWIYILIITYFTVIVIMELFSEKDWKKQIALMMVLVPFILRILQIK